jgi:hypothetical protein
MRDRKEKAPVVAGRFAQVRSRGRTPVGCYEYLRSRPCSVFYQYMHKIKVLGNQGDFVIFADILKSLCVGSGTTPISHARATASGTRPGWHPA